jgi:predicted HTH transcriptional regulator
LGLQDEIIHNINKLKKVKQQLLDIEKSISTKPISSTEQLNRLDQIYKSSIELSESEIIFDEILKGESTSREFKETFALDIKSKKRGDHIVFACVKTVAGFLNGGGGTLFIGVADNSDIKGIQSEVGTKKLFKSIDKYQLAIKDTLKKRIGTSSLNNVNFKIIKIRGKNILRIECSKSDHQIFIDNKDTYLRVGPSTELLEGPDLVNFSKERFS